MWKNKLLIIIGSLVTITIVTTMIVIFTNNNKEMTYKVTFDSNGGTAIKEQIVEQGDTSIKPNDPTKEGYLFVEWQYNNTTFNFTTKINKDITLIANWQEVEEKVEMITVKFETNGGTTISNQIIERGTKATLPAVPAKEGYIFKGWYYNDEEFNFDTPINENIVIEANWEEESKKEPEKEEKPIPKKYTITFNSDGGTKVNSQTVKEGEKATKPSNPTKDNYIFLEWTLNDKIYNFDTKVTKNITLVAKWELLGDINKDNIINSKDTTLLMRYLNGWNVEISTINADVNDDGAIDDVDVAVLRKYIAGHFDKLPHNSGAKYAITYNLNGGTFEKYVYKKYAAISLPYTLEKPIQDGYVFSGWHTNHNNTIQRELTIPEGTTGDLDYTAVWLLYGDVYNDGRVNSNDTALIRKYIASTIEFTEVQKEAADLNLDGKIDDTDVDIIRKYIAGGYGINKLPYTS